MGPAWQTHTLDVVSAGIPDLTSERQLAPHEVPIHVGMSSTVLKGSLKDGTEVAIKLLNSPTGQNFKEFIREARIWARTMHHKNIVTLLGIARVRDSVALISPWIPHNMHTYLNDHPDAVAESLLADVAHGLEYLHSQNIVYGIVRPSTVLVSDTGQACLCSFLVVHTGDKGDFPPSNILKRRFDVLGLLQGHEDVTTTESDVFAFGNMVLKICKDRKPRGITEGLLDIVQSCLQRDPKHRPSMSEVARKMTLLAEACAFTSNPAQIETPPRIPNDISKEIQQISQHPVAGGGFCDLYLGERDNSEAVALKLVRFFGSTEQDRNAARRRFLSEACLWAQFYHPRILQFYGVCEHGPLAYFMVSPFLKNGNIVNYLQNIEPDADRLCLLLETAEGLFYLHSRYPSVVHGDMKGANILITDAGTAVLTDFGLSKISHDATTSMLQGAGSPRWMAPELVITEDEGDGPFKTQQSDIYAFGHVILEVLSNKLPFFNFKEELHVLVEIMRGRRSPRPTGTVAERWLDDWMWNFTRYCTEINPRERPDMQTVVSMLRHRKESEG